MWKDVSVGRHPSRPGGPYLSIASFTQKLYAAGLCRAASCSVTISYGTQAAPVQPNFTAACEGFCMFFSMAQLSFLAGFSSEKTERGTPASIRVLAKKLSSFISWLYHSIYRSAKPHLRCCNSEILYCLEKSCKSSKCYTGLPPPLQQNLFTWAFCQ